MQKHKKITEEDLRVTEVLIAESYTQLKSSVMKAPEKALKPVTDMVRDHPMASAATAVGAGLIAYQLFVQMRPKSAAKSQGDGKKCGSPGVIGQLLSMASPLLPIVLGFVEKKYGNTVFGDRR
jgi:hypothetical protein